MKYFTNSLALVSITNIIISYFAPGSYAAQVTELEQDRALHVLNRLTYGPKPGDLNNITKLGIEKFIDLQLNSEKLEVPNKITEAAKNSDIFKLSPAQIFLNYGRPAINSQVKQNTQSTDPKKDAQKIIRETYKGFYIQMANLKIKRATYSPRQLEELMSDFWFNHFNISFDKGLCHLWTASYEEHAIRPYVFSKFRDILGATAHSAGMLYYLDNSQNSNSEINTNFNQNIFLPNSTALPLNAQIANKKRKFNGLNENYARELMELHTLGVDGGYTQKDVIELAKILTGLGLPNRRAYKQLHSNVIDNKLGYYFDKHRHDYSDKILLGHKIKGQGLQEIEEALDILAKHPSTAHHISYKLAQYFVSDKPPDTLVSKLQKKYIESDGNIKEILNTLFHSDEFWDKKYFDSKYKSPFRFTISALRASNSSIENVQPLVYFLKQQGMPPYQCLTPDGYKNTEEAWLNSDSLLKRLTFASGLGLYKMPVLRPNINSVDDLSNEFISRLSTDTYRVICDSPEQLKLSLLLGCPEFMKY